MARDTKVGMLLGLGVILLVGIFVSDHLRPQAPPPGAAAGFAGAAMDRGRPLPPAPASPSPEAATPRSTGSGPAGADVGFIPLGAPRAGGADGGGVAADTAAFPAPPFALRTEDAPAAAPTAEPLLIQRDADAFRVADPALGRRGTERSLRVRTGDTLAQLAFELYGATGYAEALAAANPQAVDTSGRPVPGAVLIVPDHAGLVGGGRAAAPPAPAPPGPPDPAPWAAAAPIELPPPAPELRAPPAAAPAPAPAYAEVTVAAGDSLSRLAARYLGGADRYLELYELNRDRLADPDDVRIGMTLRVPAGAAPAAAAPAPRAVAGVATYTVRPGDSLSKIAARVLGDAGRWEELFEANREELGSPDRVVVGQELRVPG